MTHNSASVSPVHYLRPTNAVAAPTEAYACVYITYLEISTSSRSLGLGLGHRRMLQVASTVISIQSGQLLMLRHKHSHTVPW
jgi:hypothetical protein